MGNNYVAAVMSPGFNGNLLSSIPSSIFKMNVVTNKYETVRKA